MPSDEWPPERHAEVRARCEHERRVRQYVTPIVEDMEAALAEIERLRSLLSRVAASQIDREAWEAVRAAVGEGQ